MPDLEQHLYVIGTPEMRPPRYSIKRKLGLALTVLMGKNSYTRLQNKINDKQEEIKAIANR